VFALVDSKELSSIDISRSDGPGINEREFTRYFRKKAFELHPDRGGDHETFVAFINAYQILLMRKKW